MPVKTGSEILDPPALRFEPPRGVLTGNIDIAGTQIILTPAHLWVGQDPARRMTLERYKQFILIDCISDEDDALSKIGVLPILSVRLLLICQAW